MVSNCVLMSSPGVITELLELVCQHHSTELLELVYQRHSSSLHVRNDESFQNGQTLLFFIISMVVINGGNQILKYLILQVTNLSFVISFRGS